MLTQGTLNIDTAINTDIYPAVSGAVSVSETETALPVGAPTLSAALEAWVGGEEPSTVLSFL